MGGTFERDGGGRDVGHGHFLDNGLGHKAVFVRTHVAGVHLDVKGAAHDEELHRVACAVDDFAIADLVRFHIDFELRLSAWGLDAAWTLSAPGP